MYPPPLRASCTRSCIWLMGHIDYSGRRWPTLTGCLALASATPVPSENHQFIGRATASAEWQTSVRLTLTDERDVTLASDLHTYRCLFHTRDLCGAALSVARHKRRYTDRPHTRKHSGLSSAPQSTVKRKRRTPRAPGQSP